MLRQRPGEGTTLCPAPSLISPWRVLSWLGGRGAKAFKGTATNESFRSLGPNFQGQLHSSGPEGGTEQGERGRVLDPRPFLRSPHDGCQTAHRRGLPLFPT